MGLGSGLGLGLGLEALLLPLALHSAQDLQGQLVLPQVRGGVRVSQSGLVSKLVG